MLWLVYDDMKSPDPTTALYMEDCLRNMPHVDDNNVQKFLDNWDWFNEHLQVPIVYERKRQLFYDKIHNTKHKSI